MEQNNFEKIFNENVDALKDHERYAWLDTQRKAALNLHTGSGHDAICAIDFMERIIAMPQNYIRDWLDGKNDLEWNEKFKKRLEAAEYGYLKEYDANPDTIYEVIPEISLKTYEKFGWVMVKKLNSVDVLVKVN